MKSTMNKILKSLILLLLLTSQASSDCRLRDPKVHNVAMLEHNIVIRPNKGKPEVSLDQIVAYGYADINQDGALELYPLDWIKTSDVVLADSTGNGAMVITSYGNIVTSRTSYQSITSYDVEYINRVRFGISRECVFSVP